MNPLTAFPIGQIRKFNENPNILAALCGRSPYLTILNGYAIVADIARLGANILIACNGYTTTWNVNAILANSSVVPVPPDIEDFLNKQLKIYKIKNVLDK